MTQSRYPDFKTGVEEPKKRLSELANYAGTALAGTLAYTSRGSLKLNQAHLQCNPR